MLLYNKYVMAIYTYCIYIYIYVTLEKNFKPVLKA